MSRMPLSPEERALVEGWFAAWRRWLSGEAAGGGLRPGWRARQPAPPVAAMQRAALEHPSARVRRDCLNVLDHHANDASAGVFLAAVRDPVPRVRAIALHGLACERCRETDLCVQDVVPVLAEALESDPSAKVRHDVVGILARLATRDPRAVAALAGAAEDDGDDLVRQVAQAALAGRRRDIRSRKALRRRARAGASTS